MADLSIGDNVTYTDQVGVEHEALVTAVWGLGSPNMSINVVYVDSDEDKNDPYGRQIARATSVPHKDQQSAPGRFWSYN